MFRLKFDTLKKGKPPSKLALEDDDETFYLAKSTAFAGVQTAFGLFKEVAGKTGVPGLQEGVKAMVIILDAMQVRLNIYISVASPIQPPHLCSKKTSQNTDDIESFAKRIEALTETLEKAIEGGALLSKSMLGRIDRLSKYVVIYIIPYEY